MPGPARCRTPPATRARARASAPCTDATGSRASAASRAPSCAASTPNSAASTAGSSAANCQHTSTSARCRCAYSTATLVLPAPPSPYSTATRGPLPSPASRASSSASSASRPARNTGRGATRSTSPASRPARSCSRLSSLASSPCTPVLSPCTRPCRSLNSAARTRAATSSRNAHTSDARAGSCRSDCRTSGTLVRSSATRGIPASPARRNSSCVIDNPSGLSDGGWNPYRCPAISTYRSQAATSSRQLSCTVSLSGR